MTPPWTSVPTVSVLDISDPEEMRNGDLTNVRAAAVYFLILRPQGLRKEAGGVNRHGNNVAESDELWGLQYPPISCDAIHSNF